MSATTTITVEARIWGARDHGQGALVKLYLGSGHGRYGGIRQFRTRIPLTDSDQRTWFLITLEDDVITGISIAR